VGSPFANKLFVWYSKNKRDLPWRGHPDPYAVWVSEIMLQQTRIETVLPYFARWMDRFPTVNELAAASQQEALNLWEGLGYYSRARNLHKAARTVIEEYNGQLPKDVKALRELPGIGRYTAGAIASLAFGQDEAVVDGNVKRVLSRAFDVQEPVDTSAGEKAIWALAEKHLPAGRAGDYNQALMDLGATICLPRNPKCAECPVKRICKAYALQIQEERPVFKPKSHIPHHMVAAAVIRKNGRVLIAQRPQGGLLGGMWEFPGGKQEDGEALKACLRREIQEELGVQIKVGNELGVFRHAYTHFRVTLHAFACTLSTGKPQAIVPDGLKWVKPDSLEGYPMGKLDRRISQTLANKR
jgi:A/G-specific adenine glycosylase